MFFQVISCLINGGVKSVLAVAAVWYGDTGSSPGPLQGHELAAYVGLYLGRYRPHGLGIGENGFVFRILPDHEDSIPLLPTDLEGVPVTFEVQHMATMWGEPPAHDRLGRLGRLWDYPWPHQEPPLAIPLNFHLLPFWLGLQQQLPTESSEFLAGPPAYTNVAEYRDRQPRPSLVFRHKVPCPHRRAFGQDSQIL